MSPVRATSVTVVLALVFAGCFGAVEEPATPVVNESAPVAPAEDEIDHSEHAQADSPPPEAVAALAANPALTSLHSMTLYFTPDLALVDSVPTAGSMPFPATWSKCFTQPPCGFLEFASAPSTESWALIPGPVKYDIWVVADAPVASTTLFDFGAWFGSSVGISTSKTMAHGNILPGEPVRITWESQHPETPNIVFPGDSFNALLLAAMTQDGSQALRLLTGGETPSGVSFTMARVDPAALVLGTATTETVSGSLSGPGFPVSEVAGHSERSVAKHTFTIPETANLVRFDIVGTSAAGTPDLDVDLFFGEVHLSEGHTPRETETMQLAGPALDGYRGKAVDLVVTNFYGYIVDYDIIATYQ